MTVTASGWADKQGRQGTLSIDQLAMVEERLLSARQRVLAEVGHWDRHGVGWGGVEGMGVWNGWSGVEEKGDRSH